MPDPGSGPTGCGTPGGGFSFDRETGDLSIGDVGQSAWEEIDLHPAGSRGGRNYGAYMFGDSCDGRLVALVERDGKVVQH